MQAEITMILAIIGCAGSIAATVICAIQQCQIMRNRQEYTSDALRLNDSIERLDNDLSKEIKKIREVENSKPT